jgi:hypothetical protein
MLSEDCILIQYTPAEYLSAFNSTRFPSIVFDSNTTPLHKWPNRAARRALNLSGELCTFWVTRLKKHDLSAHGRS